MNTIKHLTCLLTILIMGAWMSFAGEYGYADAVSYPASGHLRVTVSPDRVVVDYVRSYQPDDQVASHVNGEVLHSYTRYP